MLSRESTREGERERDEKLVDGVDETRRGREKGEHMSGKESERVKER